MTEINYEPDIKGIITTGVAAQGPMKWPTYDGKFLDRYKYVTASEIGKCARWIGFDKTINGGQDKDETKPREDTSGNDAVNDKWGFFERGHNVEDWFVKTVLRGKTTKKFELMGKEQRSLYRGYVSGTPDGIIIHEDGRATVFDVKSFDPRKSRKAMPDPVHVQQIQLNAYLVEACLAIEVVNGLIIHINASFYEEIIPKYIFIDEKEQLRLRRRAQKILKKAPHELPPEGVANGGCKYCPFSELCSGAEEHRKKMKEQEANMEKASNGIFR